MFQLCKILRVDEDDDKLMMLVTGYLSNLVVLAVIFMLMVIGQCDFYVDGDFCVEAWVV
jgi:hypothetical protein